MKSPILSCAMVLTLSLGALSAAHADDFTWNLNPISGSWNEAQNWTPEQVPGATDTAHFALSNITSVNLESEIDIRHIVFDANGSAYTFTLDESSNAELLLSGIVNYSGQLQNFVNTSSCNGGEGTVIQFT